MDILSFVLGYSKGKMQGDASSDDRVKYVTYMYGDTELITYPVVVGDTAKEPVSAGLIDAPIKEPTESTVYPFGGWSLSNGGAVDSNALKNVTENRTVYAAFTEAVRTYTVRFFDGDTLLKTEQVPYGGSSSYRAEKEGWFFGYWYPSPENITGNMDCNAHWIETVDFATGSWSEIAWVSENGYASQMFAIGDKRKVAFNGANYDFEIIAFDHDELADGSGKAGITLLCKKFLYADFSMNSTATTDGGWEACEFRSRLANDLSTMPEDLQAVIKLVNKECSKIVDSKTERYFSQDKLWIPSAYEVGFTTYPKLGTRYMSIEDPAFGATKSMRYYTRTTANATDFYAILWDMDTATYTPTNIRTAATTAKANPAWFARTNQIIGFCI